MPIDARVQFIEDCLEEQIELFNAGAFKDGVHSVDDSIMKAVWAPHFCERRTLDVGKVGVRPRNRVGSGLVVVDVHDLALRIHSNGFSHSLVDAVACEIPKNEEGRNGKTSMFEYQRLPRNCWCPPIEIFWRS